jgi:hypothetical protein
MFRSHKKSIVPFQPTKGFPLQKNLKFWPQKKTWKLGYTKPIFFFFGGGGRPPSKMFRWKKKAK